MIVRMHTILNGRQSRRQLQFPCLQSNLKLTHPFNNPEKSVQQRGANISAPLP